MKNFFVVTLFAAGTFFSLTAAQAISAATAHRHLSVQANVQVDEDAVTVVNVDEVRFSDDEGLTVNGKRGMVHMDPTTLVAGNQ